MKKNYLLLLVIIFSGSSLHAQTDAEKYGATITAHDLKTHLKIVASAEMEGRETATEGQRKAAAYIASQFEKMGLQQAAGTTQYQQFYPLHYDTIIAADVSINGKNYTHGLDFYTTWQSIFSADIKANKFVFAGYGITDKNYNDYRGKNVKGKVVVIFSGEPKVGSDYVVNSGKLASQWTYPGASLKAATAFEKGAKAVIMINTWQPMLRPENTNRRSVIYYPEQDEEDVLNILIASHQVGSDILGAKTFERLLSKARRNELLNRERVKVKAPFQLHMQVNKVDLQSSNVVGIIEGTDKKDEYVVLTAHYDHLGKKGDVIYFGADDDGSGTVSIVEMAEAFSKARADGHGPRRTVVFMTFSGEEKGLWGSKYYSTHPLYRLDKTSVNLNTDMVGRIDPKRAEGDSNNYVYVIGDDRISSELEGTINEANEKYVKLEIDRRFNKNDPNRYYQRSDHYNFANKGVPIIFFFNGTHADYHKPTDTLEKINFDLMQKRVRLVFYTAWQMANSNDLLKRDIPLN